MSGFLIFVMGQTCSILFKINRTWVDMRQNLTLPVDVFICDLKKCKSLMMYMPLSLFDLY